MAEDGTKTDHGVGPDELVPPASSSNERSPECYCPTCDASYAATLDTCPSDGTRLVRFGTTADPLIGRVIADNFTLRRRLGEGGMGAVYEAWQHSVGRQVAIKVIGDRVSRNWSAAKRFLREAKLSSRLAHPNIVTIYDFGQAEGELLYIVMEHLSGQTLDQLIKREGALPPDRVIDIAKQLCRALEAAHAMSIIHRDLKPANIILLEHPGAGDFVKVLDFGIAKSLSDDSLATLTHSGQILGTPVYMAPEAALDGQASVQTDLYSLGVILHHALAGSPPFMADDIRAIIGMHASEPPPPLPNQVPEGLRRLVLQLLDKQPARRCDSARSVRERLEQLERDEAGSGVTAPTAVPLPEMPPRRRRVWLGAAVVLVVAVLSALLLLRAKRGDKTAAAPAAARADAGAGTRPADAAIVAARSFDARAAPPPAVDAATAPAETVSFVIESSPQAVVYVDGKRRGKTRLELQLRKADTRVRIELRRRGYKTWRHSYSTLRGIQINERLHKRHRRPTAPPTKSKPDDDKGFVPP